MSADLEQFYEVFFEESLELLVEMEVCLLGLDVSSPDLDALNAIFRAAHSIKGGAGTFGFTGMVEMMHMLEALLDRLRKGELEVKSEMVDTFLKAGDVIKDQLAGYRGDGADLDLEAAAAICRELKAFEEGDDAEAAQDVETGVEVDRGAAVDTFAESSNTDLAAFESGDVLPAPVKREETSSEDYGFFAGAPAAPKESGAAENPKAGRAAAGSGETSIRVSVKKMDQMINLVAELVTTRAMLSKTASQVDPVIHEKLLGSMNQLERNTRDLQELAMSIRMMPISFLFSRYPRVVRDLASKLNKKVELKTVGEDTELDKALIEKIADPLMHLVRNSLDHGIEVPEKRFAADKSEQGTITLRAFHQGGSIVIEVIDDGAGFNRDKILAKAAERGIPVSEGMTDQEVWMLIFEAGFSTADAVTDVSGRGVGMDVVKQNITEMGGRIKIDSMFGVGSRISIRLPLTLAILDGLSVAVGDQMFIVPMTYIIESLQPTAVDIKTMGGQGRVAQVRGEYLPVITLHEVFNIPPKVTEIHEGILVVLEVEGRKAAMFVDSLVGQHQVVIKSLENNYRRVQGVSGATIMSDGKVALILDVATIVLSLQHG